MKRYHRQQMMRWGVTARSPPMVTLHDTRFVQYPSSGDCQTVKRSLVDDHCSPWHQPLVSAVLSHQDAHQHCWNAGTTWTHMLLVRISPWHDHTGVWDMKCFWLTSVDQYQHMEASWELKRFICTHAPALIHSHAHTHTESKTFTFSHTHIYP